MIKIITCSKMIKSAENRGYIIGLLLGIILGALITKLW